MLQSLHLTRPISGLSGSTPKTFMSGADSQGMGGDDGRSMSEGVEGVAGRVSHEKGGGSGEWVGLSLRAMATEIQTGCAQGDAVAAKGLVRDFDLRGRDRRGSGCRRLGLLGSAAAVAHWARVTEATNVRVTSRRRAAGSGVASTRRRGFPHPS